MVTNSFILAIECLDVIFYSENIIAYDILPDINICITDGSFVCRRFIPFFSNVVVELMRTWKLRLIHKHQDIYTYFSIIGCLLF